ncbi:MAG: hypothetical protein JNM65_17315 [Verrucomicrobiaceae bacterium]|nr:hypothetical protein [Verrucomicrobiaceae bacterium]
MSRLFSTLALWLLLLLAAQPASGVMSVQPRTCTWAEFDPGYDLALDVRNGPNLYAYVKQNPWTYWDPLGLSGYSDLTTSAATDLSEGRWVQGNAKAVVAAAWEAFSFGNASRMGVVEDSYANGDISAGQAAWDAAAGTATAVKDAALTYGTGGAVLKVATKYDKVETLVNVGSDVASGDYAGAALGVLGEVAPGSKKSPSPGGQTAKKISDAAKSGETAATKAGRQAHKDWEPGEGFEKEVTLPSGKRADAVNLETKQVKELKPDNARAVKRGEKQVEGYRQELQKEHGGDWTGAVETYKR